jgi:hypothetical protein
MLLIGSGLTLFHTSLITLFKLYNLDEKKNAFFNSSNALEKLLVKIDFELRNPNEKDFLNYAEKKILELVTNNPYIVVEQLHREPIIFNNV